MELLFVLEIAKHSSAPPVVTGVNPGFCYSDFARGIKGVQLYFVSALLRILARKTEVSSRTLVAGVCAGIGSHGQYMADCKNQEPVAWISTEEGARIQRRVYEQTIDLLEWIKPGISENV